ncbi:U5 small nuclear ribonucleoprotein [Rhizophlyctis rosea]|uniref:U5 small nuclear ribonucleoprotein n=1 Tax=Rhizophlyctis rosea TaxID=64517 RepID=A0AAD5SFG0_9FUNG|nr:U5 small nuclear ribonucleoprotein [Rhizophlyctis rosea]
MSDKRKDPPEQWQPSALVKRQKSEGDNLSLVARPEASGPVIRQIQRVSDLQAPIMLLSGHQSEVYTCKFSPTGRTLASGSFDRLILLWNAYGECNNTMTLKGHTGAVLELQWSRDGRNLFSASTDKTAGVWDAETGERVKKLKGHTSYVNSCATPRRGAELIATASDDNTVKIWDPRDKNAIKTFESHYPVTAVQFGLDGGICYSGGLDNKIRAWDLRKDDVVYELQGHLDTITGLRLSPDGDYLLSNAMDNTVRIWDVKPFAPTSTRLLKILEGAVHGFEKNLLKPCWSPDGDFVAAGCGDRTVVVWDVARGTIAYKLPGHKGCVNEVDWTNTILASASNDKTLFVGELNLAEVK